MILHSSLKLVDKFTYLKSSVSSTKKNINTWLPKAWTAIDRISVIWKSDLANKIKSSFFQAAVELVLQYGCTTWMLTKCMEKKLDGNYTRKLRAILNKSCLEATPHNNKKQLYSHLPPITKLSKLDKPDMWDKLISNLFLCTPLHGRAKVRWLARTYIQQLCANTRYSLKDLSEAMDNRDRWRERVREICAGSATWWWWLPGLLRSVVVVPVRCLLVK